MYALKFKSSPTNFRQKRLRLILNVDVNFSTNSDGKKFNGMERSFGKKFARNILKSKSGIVRKEAFWKLHNDNHLSYLTEQILKTFDKQTFICARFNYVKVGVAVSKHLLQQKFRTNDNSIFDLANCENRTHSLPLHMGCGVFYTHYTIVNNKNGYQPPVFAS